MATERESSAAISRYLALSPGTIEKVFTDCGMDLRRILALDGIDILPDGFRVRSHDLCAQLPEILMKISSDTFRDKDRLGNEVCKLPAVVKLREEMIRFLPGSNLLPPTRMDNKVIVGLQAKPRAWMVPCRFRM